MLGAPEVFLLVASVAWQHLPPHTRKALRASCHSGRQLHDSLWDKLRLELGVPSRSFAVIRDQSGEARPSAPTPSELRTCVSGVLQRGARLRSMTINFPRAPHGEPFPSQTREQQLLAVLDAISYPIPSVTLTGIIPTTVAVAEAMANACSHLQTLALIYYPWYNDLLQSDGGEEAAKAYAAGVVRLLSGVGPRLRELKVVRSACNWTAEAYQTLPHCTGLTSLTLEAGRSGMTGEGPEMGPSPAATESCMVEAVAQLTGLRSLRLHTDLAPASSTPEDVGPYATSVACLSALTALTSLELRSSWCYEFHGDRWSVMHRHGLELEDTCEAHRTSLLSALRAMPQLQHLRCPTLWLRPSEAAPLTALTGLTLGGLLPPSPPGAGPRAHLAADMEADAAPGGEAAPAPGGQHRREEYAEGVSMPAGLQELRLSTGASPCTLAALQLPASVRRFHCSALMLGCGDVEDLEHIKEEALQALGPAVRLLSRPETCCAGERVQVVVDGGPGLLLPRQDTPAGHVEWLQELAGLGTYSGIELEGVELRAGDVACLVRMWPNIRSLELRDVAMPMATLPLLAGLTRVRDLAVDVRRMEDVALDELEAALCVLCQQASSSLSCILVTVDSAHEDSLGFMSMVRSYLEVLGKRHMFVSVMASEFDVG